MLESKNGKGFVQINGKTIRKNATCDLHSGDELVFGLLGAHAYVSLFLFLLLRCWFIQFVVYHWIPDTLPFLGTNSWSFTHLGFP